MIPEAGKVEADGRSGEVSALASGFQQPGSGAFDGLGVALHHVMELVRDGGECGQSYRRFLNARSHAMGTAPATEGILICE